MQMFKPQLVSELPEKAAEEPIVIDEDLAEKYPCPEKLEQFKKLFYTPVNVIGANSLCLFNGGEKETAFRTRKYNEKECQWFILPLENGNIILKSVKDNNNLCIWCDKGPKEGFGFVKMSDKGEGEFEQFRLKAFEDAGPESFELESVVTGKKIIQTDRTIGIAASNSTSYATRMGIIPYVRYQNWYEDYTNEIGVLFDKMVEEIIQKNWKEYKDITLIKRDYNIVYSITFSDGQRAYAKAKPCSDYNREQVDKLGRQEMFFVDFIAKNSDNRTSTFIAPGVVSLDMVSIQIVTANEGQIAQSKVTEMYSTEEGIANIGRQVRIFHEASKQFKKAHPKEYEAMQDYSEIWNGFLSDFKRPEIPEDSDEYFGIMHGDMHEGNFLIDPQNDNKVTFFDWDITSKGWWAVDIGTFV